MYTVHLRYHLPVREGSSMYDGVKTVKNLGTAMMLLRRSLRYWECTKAKRIVFRAEQLDELLWVDFQDANGRWWNVGFIECDDC